MQRTIYAFLLLTAFQIIGFSQSPPDIITNIPYDGDTITAGMQTSIPHLTNVDFIAEAFDNGRRQEEGQFGINGNALGNILMPSQTDWDNMSQAERIFHLLNEERTARDAVDYGNGPVKGLPFTGLEQNLMNISQSLAMMYSSGTYTNTSYNDAVDGDPNIGGSGCTLSALPQENCCHELLAPNQPSNGPNSYASPVRRSTSTYLSPGNPFPGNEVFTIYGGIYNYLSMTSFRSRLILMIQDEDFNSMTSSAYGMDDNYGDIGDEGFVGIGIVNNDVDEITYFVIALLDPIPESEGCAYNCTSCDPCSSIINVNSIPYQDGVIQAQISIRAEGLVPSTGDVTMKAGNFVELNPVFEVAQGGIFHAYIDDCYFTLD